MALTITDPETERLARELAGLRKQGVAQAVAEALRKEIARVRPKPGREDKEALRRGIQEIVDRVKRLPIIDDRSPDEIIGYNEHGSFD